MKEVTNKEIKEKNLKFITQIVGTNLSHTILILQRMQEISQIDYYLMEFVAVNEETHNGQIIVSFYKD